MCRYRFIVLLFWICACCVHATSTIIINKVMYDSPLNEVVSKPPYSNGEFIELYNLGDENVNLQDWSLDGDGITERLYFDSLVLFPGNYLVVAYRHKNSYNFWLSNLYSSYAASDSCQIIYQNKLILSNSGETITLYNSSGHAVDAITYDGTSNKRKPDRLSADNTDSIPGDSCVCLNRVSARFERSGCVANGTSRWQTDTVHFCSNILSSDMAISDNYLTDNVPLNSNLNYIVSVTPLDPAFRVTMEDDIPSVEGNVRALTQVNYFDGLGRLSEEVQVGITPSRSDLVSLLEYDGLEQQSHQWLPVSVANGNGAYVPRTTYTSAATDMYTTNKPYILYDYDALNRPTAVRQAGIWNSHPSRVLYSSNGSDDAVKQFSCNVSGNLIYSGTYANQMLYSEKTLDEDGKSVTVFTDKLNRVVLERRGTDNDTYYVYDDLNRLRYVLPPAAASSITQGTHSPQTEILKNYAYLYRYDGCGNIVSKRLPGCDSIRMGYDMMNHLVLYQDGNMRAQGRWSVTKYDKLGRIVYTGLIDREIPDSELASIRSSMVFFETFDMQNDFDDTGYTDVFFINEITPLTINYYDTYDFLETLPTNIKEHLTYKSKQGYDTAYEKANGLLTGTRVYNLYDSSYTVTAYYYDYKGRVIQESNTGVMGLNTIYRAYNFDGTVSESLQENTLGIDLLTERYQYTYDHSGRLLTTTYQVDDVPAVLLSSYEYDERGNVAKQMRYNNTDTVTYAYNIRNWLTHTDNEEFSEHISYNDDVESASKYYNSNIAHTHIAHKQQTPVNTAYQYDDINRLTTAANTENDNLFEHYSYDAMGNIQTLERDSIDDLSYSYDGNQLIAIIDYAGSQGLYDTKEYNEHADTTVEMGYDANGNLTYDLDRGICAIHYNLLNLPDTIQFMNGNQIVNLYDAAGTKHQTKYFTVLEPVTVPIGNILRLEHDGHGVMESGTRYDGHYSRNYTRSSASLMGKPISYRIEIPDGYVLRTEWETDTVQQSTSFYYYLRDHLGNNCAVWDAAEDSIVQRTLYYASGLPMAQSTEQGVQPYKYNGKEFIEMHGLDEYDSQARWYYPAVMRTTTMDPLAEKYYHISPYAWCENNMVNFIDPDGCSTHTDQNGEVVAVYDDNDLNIYRHSNEKLASWGDVYERILTKDNAEIMGQSLHALSFADQGAYNSTGVVKHIENKPISIDFGSYALGNAIIEVIDQQPSLVTYASNARSHGKWDLKTQYFQGSQLEKGVYLSPRDAGNFLAGAVKAQSGVLAPIVQFGYGAYNISQNNLFMTGLITMGTGVMLVGACALTYCKPNAGVIAGMGAMSIVQRIMSGEDTLTQLSINLGFNYVSKK